MFDEAKLPGYLQAVWEIEKNAREEEYAKEFLLSINKREYELILSLLKERIAELKTSDTRDDAKYLALCLLMHKVEMKIFDWEVS